MTDAIRTVCETCLRGSYDGALNFPQQLGMLAEVGVEGYFADLRAATVTYYPASGGPVTLAAEATPAKVTAAFNAAAVESAVRQSQAGEHSYRDFLRKVKEAGCSAYLVSMPGKRVVYLGRTGESHVEFMP
jgi:uncharacterized protein YbcV (DUF1398 family)